MPVKFHSSIYRALAHPEQYHPAAIRAIQEIVARHPEPKLKPMTIAAKTKKK